MSKARRWDISTDSGLGALRAFTAEQRLQGKRVIVQEVSEKRSLDQNAMFYALYQQIAQQRQEQSVNDVRRECKLRYGVPILRAESEQFRHLYDKGIKSTLLYEEKLEAMDILPVTRLMTKPQGTQYIDEIIRDYSRQGYALAHPSEEDMRAAG